MRDVESTEAPYPTRKVLALPTLADDHGRVGSLVYPRGGTAGEEYTGRVDDPMARGTASGAVVWVEAGVSRRRMVPLPGGHTSQGVLLDLVVTPEAPLHAWWACSLPSPLAVGEVVTMAASGYVWGYEEDLGRVAVESIRADTPAFGPTGLALAARHRPALVVLRRL